jgi:mono/diheme cytochrome c family protein
MFILSLLLLTSPAFSEDDLAGRVYSTYCTNCHGDAVQFANNTLDLKKTDIELIDYIRNGGSKMPAYGWMISKKRSGEIIKYLRSLKVKK